LANGDFLEGSAPALLKISQKSVINHWLKPVAWTEKL
jgi:hypothetical protein